PLAGPPHRAPRGLLGRPVGARDRGAARDPRGHREVAAALRHASAPPRPAGTGRDPMSGQRGPEIGDRYAEWDAAYVLGALSSAERLEFEAHLGTCVACSARVAEMAGMPGILGRLDGASAEELRDLPADADAVIGTQGAVAHLARRVHRRRRMTALAGAAAIVAAAVGGATLGGAAAGPAVAATRLEPVGGPAGSA